MVLDNLNNDHFTAAEKTAIMGSLTAIETILLPKIIALSKEERKKYGSINEQNKLIVNKTRDYRNNDPGLSNPDVNWVEFENDFNSRDLADAVVNRLKKLVTGIENKKILHDFDNYKVALKDYGYSQYKAGSGTPGFQEKVDDMAQFFNKSTRISTSDGVADIPVV